MCSYQRPNPSSSENRCPFVHTGLDSEFSNEAVGSYASGREEICKKEPAPGWGWGVVSGAKWTLGALCYLFRAWRTLWGLTRAQGQTSAEGAGRTHGVALGPLVGVSMRGPSCEDPKPLDCRKEL